MKKIILPLLAIAMTSTAFAQNYYYVKKEGANPNGYTNQKVFQTGNTIILNKPSNDVLSPAQTIPFTFNFYGNPVTSYKASDNGYITFNTSGTASVAPGLSLPTGSDPNNAIYAFWKDFELKSAPNAQFPVQILTYTTGTAPNRRHNIQFFGLSLKGANITANADVYSFAIVLYEGAAGRFDIIYNGYGSSGQTGIIGCENSDGTFGTAVGGSASNYKVATDYTDAKNIVYQFTYGTQADLDPALITTNLAKFYKIGTPVSIGGTIANYGKTAITSLEVYYSIDGGATQTYALNSINIQPSGESITSFTHNIPWTSGVAGALSSVKVWVGNPNGSGIDDDLANSELTSSVLRNNGTANVPRNVLMEEATGAWCGYCPDGHLIMKDIVDNNPGRVIAVMHHNADNMTNTQSDILNTAYANGYPSGFIDRVTFSSRNTWSSDIANRLAIDAPVKVTITAKNWNPTTRTIVFRVNARFSDYWAGDIRIGGMVTENDVRGSGGSANNAKWNQVNYYSKNHSSGGVGGASHPLYDELAHMEGYYHQHVARSIPGGAYGLAAVIPDVAEPDYDYTYDFTYVLPAETKVTYSIDNNTPYCSTNDFPGGDYGINKLASLNLVGFVAEYDGANEKNRPILNAGEVKLWDLANDIRDIKSNVSVNSVYPNPAKDFANIKIDLKEASNVKIEVFNAMGQLVSVEQDGQMESGMNLFFLNTGDYASGIYTINITTPTGVTSTKLNVVK